MPKKINKQIPKNRKTEFNNEKHTFFLIFMKWANEWLNVITILLKPFSLISIILSAVSLYFAQTQDGVNRLIFEIVSSIIFSVSGGIISYYFIEHFGNTLVIKKSIGAIRNLQLIKSKIENINERISSLKADKSGEIANLTNNIHKDILNSISDWADVNPNAEYLKDFYEEIDSIKKEVASVKKERDDLEAQKNSLEAQKNNLDTAKNEEIVRLSREIEEKDKEILRLNANLFGLQQGVGSLSSSASLSTSGYGYGGSALGSFGSVGGVNSVGSTTCAKCGKSFLSYVSLSGMIRCPYCGTPN